MIRYFSPALTVCFAFLLLSSIRVALAGRAIPYQRILNGGFPFLELFGVLIAGVLIRATRGRHWVQVGSLMFWIPAIAGWSASTGEGLIPFQEWMPDSWLHFLARFHLILACVSILPVFLLGQARKTGQLGLELLPCFLMVSAYPFVPLMIDTSGGTDWDTALLRADEWMFGGVNPHFWISARMQSWMTEWLAFCYSLYGALILVVFGMLILSDRKDELRRFAFRFTLVLAIGYTLYTLVPVQGPVFKLEFREPIDLRYLQGVKEALMDRTRIEWDCFPSLHTALTLLVWGTLFRISVRFAWCLLPVIISIPVACVYLRYHYVVDVIAGCCLAAGVLVKIKKAPGGGSPA